MSDAHTNSLTQTGLPIHTSVAMGDQIATH